MTYKLKTTRPTSVKPNKALGIIQSEASDKFKIKFLPTATEKPFVEGDRVTVLIGVLPDSNTVSKLLMTPIFGQGTGFG